MRLTLKNFAKRLYQKSFEEDVFSRTAAVAFYFSFAFFPLLLFLISLFGLILDNASQIRGEFFRYLSDIMPPSAYNLVQVTIFEVLARSTRTKATIGLVITLWSASAGFDNLRIALNSVYGLEETRARWKTLLMTPLITICVGILAAISLGIIFYGSILLKASLPAFAPILLKVAGWLIVFIALLIAFIFLYRALPDHKERRRKWLIPGAVVGIILWLLLSAIFRLYLQFFDFYSSTYGSLGAMIILMLWLYLTALVILLGAIINSIFKEFSELKTET